LLAGLDDWRDLVGRSLNTSLWLACFIAVVGSLAAPMLLPLLFGPAYSAAVAPFQLVIWMIPVAWFSGHFRFSLIAAGHQRWEFAVSAATAVVTIASSGLLTPSLGSLGAAMALLLGGIVNAMLAYVAMSRHVGWVPLGRVTRPVVLTTAAALVVGLVMAAWSGTVAATAAGAIILAAVAVRQDNDLVRLVRPWIPW
jgi:O-antigen/teichoic acid export membrane protein